MTKHLGLAILAICGFWAVTEVANAADLTVPEPFQGFDASSTYSIRYGDLNALYKSTVVNVGRSTREKSQPVVAKTGTRMKQSVKRSTDKEGNRFYFEALVKNEGSRQAFSAIQKSLEQVPAEAPLEYFNRNEQLAYWLNLYNLTVLNEIIKVYPKKNLKKILTGKKSILSKKLLKVAGISLSLDDIQFIILKNNYNNNPLIMYGLYQGIIGGPNIRKRAYTAENVYRNLRQNAVEFVNSNRGTYSKNTKVFRVSSLYQRNEAYFNDFDSALKEHLLSYLEDPEYAELQAATTLKPDIDNWKVTDLYGTYREIGGSIADNSAAMIGAIQSTSNVDGQPVTSIATIESASLVASAPSLSRYSPELLTFLNEIKLKQNVTAAKNARVTVEELGTVSDIPEDKDHN